MLVKTLVENVGTLHIRPNWRYDLLQNPGKYGLREFVSVPESNAGCLKRFISAGLEYTVTYSIPEYIQELANGTENKEQKDLLINLWYQNLDETGNRKVDIETNRGLFIQNPVWNLKLIDKINDAFVQKLICHVSNYKYDRDIAYALRLGQSQDHKEIHNFIGYCIYANISDREIAKRWRIRPQQVEAIRLLFFDFSKFPKDRMANFSYLRQLTNIGLFSDVDFMYYKRVYELGELGLKAQVDFYSLTNQEKQKIEEYLGKSVVANTLNLNFSIKNQKDAVAYGLIVSNLANYYIKQKEADYFGAKIRNLDASTRRIEGGLLDAEVDTTANDEKLLDLLRQHSLQEPKLEYKSLDSLTKL